MPIVDFSLQLPRSKVLLLYGAQKNRVVVAADNGQRLSIPWLRLQPFVTDSGISGRFRIEFDDAGKCLGLERV